MGLKHKFSEIEQNNLYVGKSGSTKENINLSKMILMFIKEIIVNKHIAKKSIQVHFFCQTQFSD